MPEPARPGPAGPGDPYKVLQVDPEADPEVIQAAYRRLAQKYHPDVARDPESAARMAAINVAWETLRDPARRAAHDRARAAEDHARATHGRARAATWHAGPGAHAAGPAPAHDRASGRPADRAPGAATGPRSTAGHRPPGETNPSWTSGRSSTGGGYDPSTMRAADGLGAAGPPPGNPSGSVLSFGRYAGWSLGEIARRDLEYLEWLDRMPIGRPHRDEVDAILRRAGRRRSATGDDRAGRGLFRRR